ncbi:O-methyltransferase [Hyphomonas sp.]|jgi:predicted O-methyltransferase YrrM|uniref:O-methyltransferase n=1 Tax=Hyphomonas sp. TaxID=87 RepID=UPI0039E233F1
MPFDSTHPRDGLNDPEIADTLSRLHRDARRDRWVFARALPSIALGFLRGRSVFESAEPFLSDAYIPVSPELGRLMYQVARAAKARNIVEFGSSFGISAIYLAAAARENGGRFTGTEMLPHKFRIAESNLVSAGLKRWADIREGDALESLEPLDGPVDFVFLDGWKEMYIPILHLLEPKLADGAIIFADNIHSFRKTLKPFVDYVCDPRNSYETTVVPIGSGVSISTWREQSKEKPDCRY